MRRFYEGKFGYLEIDFDSMRIIKDELKHDTMNTENYKKLAEAIVPKNMLAHVEVYDNTVIAFLKNINWVLNLSKKGSYLYPIP